MMLSHWPRAPVTGAVLLLVTATAAGLLALAPTTASAAPRATTFVHSAKSGELRGDRLTLRGVGRHVTWVSHGQGRTSGVVSVPTLHRRLFSRLAPPGWPRSNTASPAPTAALNVSGQRPGGVVGLKLSRPRYNASRQTVSYRVRRLDNRRGPRLVGRAAQRPVPDRFGPASLSIAALGRPLDIYHCSTTVDNDTDYAIQATSSGLWPNDSWNPGIPPGTVLFPTSDPLVYGSDGGVFRGCGNSSTWTIIDGPPGVRGVTFNIYTTIPYNSGLGTSTCTSSAANFVCQLDPGSINFWSFQPAGGPSGR
jgi:hypothetical protein